MSQSRHTKHPADTHDTLHDRRPNIVFIVADDLGWADLGVYGQTDYPTPHLDRLADQGVRFTQAYSNSAVCSATRFALITGRYQYRLRGGLEEPIAKPAHYLGLPPEHPTLPSLLADAGYHTALIGKWHLGALPHFGPLKSGYQKFFGNYSGVQGLLTLISPVRSLLAKRQSRRVSQPRPGVWARHATPSGAWPAGFPSGWSPKGRSRRCQSSLGHRPSCGWRLALGLLDLQRIRRNQC